MSWRRAFVVCRTDLRQLRQSPDFWMPMVLLGLIFFVVAPLVLLFAVDAVGNIPAVESAARALDVLPSSAKAQIQGNTDEDMVSYALAVFLFAPLAVVVPLTISTAIGSSTIVGERERGTGEFLAHSPAEVGEIYLGKLAASLLPGYVTTLVGFGLYSLIVNVIVGRDVGGWFFPTPEWLLLMFWVVPPFLAITLSVVLRLSARVKSTAAAQQASGLVSLPLILLSYGNSTGVLFGAGGRAAWALGAVAWVFAFVGLRQGARSVSRARLLGVADEQ